MKTMNALEKIKSLAATDGDSEPLVSLFIPLRGTYLPTPSIFNGLIRSANLILQREGRERVTISHPDWKTWERDGARTLAIYHAAGMTTFMPLSITMEPRVVVANSFHVKPLIASAHHEARALLMTFHRSGCSLHQVTANAAEHLETFVPAKFVTDEDWLEKISRTDLRDFLDYLSVEVGGLVTENVRFLAIDCSSDPLLRNEAYWSRLRIPVNLLPHRGLATSPDRSVLDVQAKLEEELAFTTYGIVHHVLRRKIKREPRDLTELGQLIVHKKITQLFVSLDDLHFGEFDLQTGEATVHKGQQNTRDDDLLDDFAELALRNGIEVRVVPRKFLPHGKSFIVA